MGQRRQIHAHERDQGPKIQQFGAVVIADQESPQQRDPPTNITLLAGIRVLGWMAPKNFLGMAPLRPMPYSSRAAPSCDPMPEPTVAISSVMLMALVMSTPPAIPAT